MADDRGEIQKLDPAKSPLTRSKKSSPKYLVEERERKVKTYPFTTSEILTISLLNPFAAALLGWGVNVYTAWAEMPDGAPNKSSVGVASAALLVLGGCLQILTWGLVVRVLYECRSKE